MHEKFYNDNSANSNSNIYTHYINNDNSNVIFLSLGNSITGITQRDLYNININNLINNNNNNIIFYENSNIITSTDSYHSYYLLDNSYNYDYTNILYYFSQTTGFKYLDISLSDNYKYIVDISKNIYKNSLYSYHNLYKHNFSFDMLNFDILNTDYDGTNYKFDAELNSDSDSDNTILSLDFKYNYNNVFNTKIELNLRYISTLLNFYKIILNNKIYTGPYLEFNNVKCLLTLDEDIEYPNNNIRIDINPKIDSLNRVIEDLGTSQTINSIFIPNKNGSNLSKKHIYGLVALGNKSIPRLLSILPYTDTTATRGHLHQFQLTSQDISCTSEINKIETKLASQINKSNNSNNFTKNINYANRIRSRIVTRNIIDDANFCDNPIDSNSFNRPYSVTPLWRRYGR